LFTEEPVLLMMMRTQLDFCIQSWVSARKTVVFFFFF